MDGYLTRGVNGGAFQLDGTDATTGDVLNHALSPRFRQTPERGRAARPIVRVDLRSMPGVPAGVEISRLVAKLQPSSNRTEVA